MTGIMEKKSSQGKLFIVNIMFVAMPVFISIVVSSIVFLMVHFCSAWRCSIMLSLPSPLLSEQRYCDARRHAVCVRVCLRRACVRVSTALFSAAKVSSAV